MVPARAAEKVDKEPTVFMSENIRYDHNTKNDVLNNKIKYKNKGVDNMKALHVTRLYNDRNLIPLQELIDVRTQKVNELIANEDNIKANATEAEARKYGKRIDEYSTIVDMLRELSWYRYQEGIVD